MFSITKEQKKLIENNPLALSTINENLNLHCICVAFVKVVSSNQILITDNYMVQTPKNLLSNNKIALAVWDNKHWDNENLSAYEFIGTAEYFNSGPWLNQIKQLKDNQGFPAKGAIIVTIKKVKKLA